MKEQAVLVPVRCNLRKAELVDVPAVARLIDPPPLASRPGVTGHAVISATRLVLAHVGLAYGEFWVATDEQDVVRAATVLLPPRQDAAGRESAEEEGVQAALRLHLGLSPAELPGLADLVELTDLHWLLIAVAAPGHESVLESLLAVTLPVVADDGLPVLSVHPGRAAAALLDAGFVPHGPGTGLVAMLRPAQPQPQPHPQAQVAADRAPAMA